MGLELLHNLGALDDQAQLTEGKGMKMVEMAIEPRLAAAILTASKISNLRYNQFTFQMRSDTESVTKS